VQAAKTVLMEIASLLRGFGPVVIVGGWVPDLVLPNKNPPHVGSIDVDLALDVPRMQQRDVTAIVDMLRRRGYKEGPKPSIFYRNVRVKDKFYPVRVDLMG